MNYGIYAGTGTTAPANADYAMQTPIAHGSGSGQLQYQPTAVGAAGIVGSNVDLVITRAFVNASGATITLREVGFGYQVGSSWYFLMAHDAVNQAILNTEVGLVSYTIRTTV